MEKPSSLIRHAADERARLIRLVAGLSDVQSNYKPNDQTWSTSQYLEHLVLAEMSGVSKIWSAAEGVRKGKPIWQGEHTNRLGLAVDVSPSVSVTALRTLRVMSSSESSRRMVPSGESADLDILRSGCWRSMTRAAVPGMAASGTTKVSP